MGKWISIFVLLFSLPCFGGALSAPFTMNSARVLPKNVRSLRVSNVTTTIDDIYNDFGLLSTVAEPMNIPLSYRRLLTAEPNENLRKDIEAGLKAQNKDFDLDAIAGYSVADVRTRATVAAPSLAYGVTDRWTVAVAVPIVYTNLSVATSFRGTEQLQAIAQNFSEKSARTARTIVTKLNDVINTEATTKGYQPLRDQERTEVGDLMLVSKYLIHNGVGLKWAIANTLTAPTARYRDVNKVIDPAPGDGQWDLGATSIIQYALGPELDLIQTVGYTIQFADRQETRIPIDVWERLSSDIDWNANRDLGDQVRASLGLRYRLNSLVNFGGGIHGAYKERDLWSGNLATPDRYEVLGHETEQFYSAGLLTAGVSTISKFRSGSFPVPMTANLGFSHVFDGRNVRKTQMWSLDVAVYF